MAAGRPPELSAMELGLGSPTHSLEASQPRLGGIDDYARKKEQLLREVLQDKREDEVRLADMETKLREFVLEVVRPTIMRNVKLQTETQWLAEDVRTQSARLEKVCQQIDLLQERSDAVVTFRERLDGFAERSRALEEQLTDQRITTLTRIEQAEEAVDRQKSTCARLGLSVDRVTQDMGELTGSIRKVQAAVDQCGQKSREYMESEHKRVDLLLQGIKEVQQSFANEVWGPEDPEEFAPPSLRRLDMQMRRAKADIKDALADLAALRRLDGEMTDVKQKLAVAFERLDEVAASCADHRRRIDKIALDSKHDFKHASNLMAAFTANLMQDIRVGFSAEVKDLQGSYQEIQKFVRDAQAAMAELEQALGSTRRHVEAALRECRTDLEGLEARRRRDRQGLEDGLAGVSGRAGAALEASEATLLGLEHLSGVVGMALQGARMAAALDTSDFADRKASPYVGAHGIASKKKTGLGRGGLDPEILFRLPYQCICPVGLRLFLYPAAAVQLRV
uniref:Uncharacterized protein n=1 Tax=Alexandrium monilatum TaxID=311494 RepID=A0A7S4Q2X1_9DINO